MYSLRFTSKTSGLSLENRIHNVSFMSNTNDTKCAIDRKVTKCINISMSTWQNRAKTRMKALGLTQESLAAPLGVKTRGAVGHYFSGRRQLSAEQAIALCRFLDIAHDDLFDSSPKPSPIPSFKRSCDEDEPSATTLQSRNLESDFIQVPVYDVQLAAGNGTHVDHDNIVESLPISRKYLSDSGISADSATIVKVRGESMEHTLCDGDVVLVNTGINRPVSGKVFAFDFDGDLRVKRFIKRLDGSWRIVSDNEDKNIYADETLSAHNVEQLRLIGQVVTIVERKLA